MSTFITKTYDWTVSGVSSDKNTWWTRGQVTIKNSEFPQLFDKVMRDSFFQLTQGKAVYGQPGVGCKGPYEVCRIEISFKDFSSHVSE